MDDFINVIKRDPQIQIKIRDMLDKNKREPYNYQSKMEYDTSIQNVILKEAINLMGPTLVDIYVDLKMKISILECLESRFL